MGYAHSAWTMGHRKKNRPRRSTPPWVGPWLKQVREARRETVHQGEVAARMDRDQPYVSRLESGEMTLPADDLPLVLRAYEVSEAQFAKKMREAGSVAA